LWLGTTGPGSSNLYNSGSTTATSANLTSLPTNGVTVYARLWSMIGGSWRGVDYTYTEAGAPAPAVLTNPVPGNQLAGSSANFSWTSGSGPVAYELWLGTTGAGSSDLYNSGSLTTTSASVTGLPANGVKIYARLWSQISGRWQCTDYAYTEAGTPVPASLISPSQGSVLTSSSATFSWTPGAGPTQYDLWLGTTGVGSNNLFNSGSLTSTSVSVTGLPANGVTIYTRLWSMISGVWQFTDYTITQAGTPSQGLLTSPSPGGVLPGSNVTFTWLAGSGPTQYDLWLSVDGAGLNELYNSGPLTTTSANVTGLPTNGVKLFARLWSRINGIWQFTDYTYTEAGTPVAASLTSPTQGSVLTSSSATFSWTPGAGPTQYDLWLGTTGVGSNNLYISGSLTTTSVNVTGLPANGVTIYVRLWWMMNGVWQFADYTITEAGTPAQASLTFPTQGSQLPGSSATFIWTPGSGPTAYDLWLGSTGIGTSDLYNSGSTTLTTANVTSLPTNGATVYARLWSRINGIWQFTDYTYTAQ
jgi:serine protease